MTSTLFVNIGELVTLAPLVRDKKVQAHEEKDLGAIKGAWLYIKAGKVADYGTSPWPLAYEKSIKVDALGKLVLPGLIDSHTHPFFAGNRSKEFCLRLDGKSYQDIAAMGGGIKSTVKASRAASDEELVQLCTKRIQKFIERGVTAVEVKSGYGLSVDEELRHLRLLNQIKSTLPCELHITCLAFHDHLGPESKETYIAEVTNKLLPILAKEQLCASVDAFIEEGYYRASDIDPFMKKAQELGLFVRIHADEFSDAKAAVAAARWQAKSADHLQFADSTGIASMAQAGVIATLLPSTSIYTKIPYTQAPKYFKAGVAVALATDYNPGSSPIANLPLIASLGALHCQLNTAQCLSAITRVPAFSLNLAQTKGSLDLGFDADLVITNLSSKEEFLADFGQTPMSQVWIKGSRVY